MLAAEHILNENQCSPSQDMVLSNYYLTMEELVVKVKNGLQDIADEAVWHTAMVMFTPLTCWYCNRRP